MLAKFQDKDLWAKCSRAVLLFKMSADPKCRVCKEPSRLVCGNCHGVAYCRKDHQKSDWKKHKPDCLPYKVVSDATIGRHLIATRSISEGEIIIKEPPVIAGPAQMTPPVCLGCYKPLSQSTAKDCSACGWPVCSEECEKSSAHLPECDITCKHKNGKVKITTFEKDFPHPSYQCLTVLRCLYMKKGNPELWKKLMNLESHTEERKSTLKYNADRKFIAEFIPKFFSYTDFTLEEIQRVAGIIQVNAHEVPLTEPGHVAVYEKASFLEHNCRANCMKSFTNAGELVIRAAGGISPGEHLSICYTDPLWGSQQRKAHLLETKFFHCQCHRCQDPTELKTHFNSLKCADSDCQGYSIPSVNKKKGQIWKCQKCKKTKTADFAKIVGAFAKLDKKNEKACKGFLSTYGNLLHPNHHILISVKLALVDLLGWPGMLHKILDDDLEWVVKTCREVYDLATVLVPAENRLRGILLYQLQFALAECDQRRTQKRKPDEEQTENISNRFSILSKACKLLSYEPDQLPEGKMAQDAREILRSLEENLMRV